MDTMSAPEAAQRLGVSLPRVHRLLDGLGAPRSGRGIGRPVTPAQLRQMRSTVGATPDRTANLDRVELLVLSVLCRAALGLESDRAVARATGVSVTGASRALTALTGKGYVTRHARKVVRGTPTLVNFWVATRAVDRDPALHRAVKTTITPAITAPHKAARRVPHRFAHLFWNADLGKLDPRRDGTFIAQRLLDTGDTDAFIWTLENIGEDDIHKAVTIRGTDPRVKRFVINAQAENRQWTN